MSRAWPAALGALLLLAAGGLALLVVVRVSLGVPFGSDAYSYLVWARDLVEHGDTAHAPYDYTVPKPLELGVATLATLLGAPLTLFGWWTAVALLAAAAAAAALAGRLGGPLAALAAGVLALLLPVLFRGALAGDSNAPYAACVVGAAAAGAGAPLASGLLAVAGLLRPEAWGIALLNLLLGLPRSGRRDRLLALAAVLAPPALWLGLDRLLADDWLYGAHTVERYVERFGPPGIALLDLPRAVAERVDDLVGWPTVALAAAALVVGVARRPLDPAVVYPAALAAALALAVADGQVTADALGRMLTALALFACAGAGVALAALARQRGTGPLLAATAAVACLALVAGPLRDARDALELQADRAGELDQGVGAAARRALAGGGLAVTARSWQGALALYGELPRARVVPSAALGGDVPRSAARAFLVDADARRPGAATGLRLAARTRHWKLYAR